MKHIYFYGDSNTYGFDPADFFSGRYPKDVIWTSVLKDELADMWHVTANGMNGREIPSSEGDFRMLFRRMENAPLIDIFAIMLGSNDYLVMRVPDETKVAERMERALVRISEHIDMEKILLIAPPAMAVPETGGFGGGMFAGADTSDGRLSKEYKKTADRLGCRFLDALSWNVPLTSDGVHFSEEGHAVFAKEMARYLRTIV